MRVGIIAIARNEQLYINEWVKHHLALGFDRIIIADNDDEFILPGVVRDPRVIHENYCGVANVQPKAYTELYRKYRKCFDWLLFIDIDEFVMCYTPVKEFLEPFKCDVVRISCKHYDDGEMLDTDGDYRVVERFTTPRDTGRNTFVKSFINTRVSLGKRTIYGHGIYDDTLDARNALGERCENNNQHTTRIVHERCWLNHYPTKTIGEYIRQKWRRGGANNNPTRYSDWEKYFFRYNRRTEEKVKYANKLIKQITNA